jgi:hypothetical protein
MPAALQKLCDRGTLTPGLDVLSVTVYSTPKGTSRPKEQPSQTATGNLLATG